MLNMLNNIIKKSKNASILQIEILRDRRIFVYFHLNKGGQYRIRSPPDLKFELKIKFQIQEDKTVKYAPKKLDKLLEVYIFMKGRKRRNKKYSPEFKISVIMDMREHHLSYGETMRKYFPHLAPRGIGFLKQWERIYLEEGKVGFSRLRNGRGIYHVAGI